VTAGQAYTFTPTATDPRGRALRFSISNKPGWASFSVTSGTLSGTPSTANVGTFANIVIKVSDSYATASLAPFSISVASPPVASKPPVISGTPPTTATAGSAYSFQPTASDPNGGSLSFSVQNKPTWAAFSIATGSLSGTPAATDVGTYSGIVISTSDATASAALPAFAITVSAAASPPPPAGAATLSWTPTTLNTDGSALTNPAGYRIHYGTSASNLSQMVQVSGAGATSYSLGSLTSGTWYFAVSSYTTSGVESALSNPVTTTIQ
jgi:hypothetical protein